MRCASLVVRPVTEYLYHHVGAERFLARADDLCALINVVGIGVTGFHTRSRFDDDLNTRFAIAGDHRRYQCHAPLPRKTFTGNTNNHGVSSLAPHFLTPKPVGAVKLLKLTELSILSRVLRMSTLT